MTVAAPPLAYQFWIFTLLILVTLVSNGSTISLFTHTEQDIQHINNDVTTTKTVLDDATTSSASNEVKRDLSIGPCTWAIGRKCPDEDIRFYLYTRRNLMDRQCLHIDETLESSNLTESFFDPKHPTKIIIHGYNSNMFLNPLHMMREEYLAKAEYNIIYVDWSILSPGPCYISAVHNTKHAGACVAQLVERILDYGSADIHVIGFSLGAQLANYIGKNLSSFTLPRITGLDPAMPLFITAPDSDKLDPSDAAYVDVIHTNALVQGKLERCGHADFYMNGGIMQPGCYSQGSNPIACSHQRAPAYFLESIRTTKGFWGWACSSYIAYLLGMCPMTNYLVEAGDNIRYSTKGMFLINTNDTAPYALGKWTDLPTLGVKQPVVQTPMLTLTPPQQRGDPLLKQVDQWGKLDSYFNNMQYFPMNYYQYPSADNWTYFKGGTSGSSNANSHSNTSKSESGNSHKGADADTENSIEEQDIDESHGDNETPRRFNWNEYRRNLTVGHIENSIFSIPCIHNEESATKC